VPGLTRWLRRRRGADRGAVTVLVAVLMSSGVLLGMTAYAVDLGVLYADRDQALNAANAAAMAAAQACVRPGNNCGRTAVDAYATANVRGIGVTLSSTSAGDPVCGVDNSTGRLPPCDNPTGAKRCLGDRDPSTSYAEVHATTTGVNGSTVLPPSFAGSVVPGYTRAGVQACARVAWGPPKGPYAAFGLSKCRFDQLTNGGVGSSSSRFWAVYQVPPVRAELTLVLQAPVTRLETCGNLGYLESPTDDCRINRLNEGDELDGSTDNATHTAPVPPGCLTLLQAKAKRPTTADPQPYLLMPIYRNTLPDLTPTPHTDFKPVVGIAAFQVTGYRLDNNPSLDWLTGAVTACGSALRCIRGYFVWANIIDGSRPAPNWHQTLAVATFKTVG